MSYWTIYLVGEHFGQETRKRKYKEGISWVGCRSARGLKIAMNNK